MQIGNNTRKLMQIYNLTNEEVTFSQLIATGRTQAEAYCIAYPNKLLTGQSPTTEAHVLITTAPGIPSLIKALKRTTTNTDNATHPQDQRKTGKGKGKGANIDTKEAQLRELNDIYRQATDAKQRAEILKQVADLQQLKKEENKAEEQRIHYYLPIKCELCPFKPTKKDEEGDK